MAGCSSEGELNELLGGLQTFSLSAEREHKLTLASFSTLLSPAASVQLPSLVGNSMSWI